MLVAHLSICYILNFKTLLQSNHHLNIRIIFKSIYMNFPLDYMLSSRKIKSHLETPSNCRLKLAIPFETLYFFIRSSRFIPCFLQKESLLPHIEPLPAILHYSIFLLCYPRNFVQKLVYTQDKTKTHDIFRA